MRTGPLLQWKWAGLRVSGLDCFWNCDVGALGTVGGRALHLLGRQEIPDFWLPFGPAHLEIK